MKIQPTHLICDSGVDVIPPGQPNQPAGAPHHSFDGWDEEEDLEGEEYDM